MGNKQPKSTPTTNTTAEPSPAMKAVLKKIKTNSKYMDKLKSNQDLLHKFASVLSDEESMKKTYLATDWLQSVDFYKQTMQSAEANADPDEHKKKKLKLKFASSSDPEMLSVSNNINVSQVEDFDEEDEEDRRELTEEENRLLENELKSMKKTDVIKIKIIISEVSQNRHKQNIRKLVSPVLSKLSILPEFGLFHSALMIGPWLIEWNTGELVIPRKCVSNAAFLSADIDAITSAKRIDEVVDNLAKTIIRWNVEMKYKDNGGDKSVEGNCQDFVDDVLRELNISLNFEGTPLGEFFKKLRQKGTCGLKLPLTEQFRTKFELTEKYVRFETHQELDDFVQKLIDKEPLFHELYPGEYQILKSFDRGFWLRHFKFVQNEKFKPAMKVDPFVDVSDLDSEERESHMVVGCPFGDPTLTHSMRFLD